MVSELGATLEEPIPVPETPPAERLPPREWIRRNLFDGWFNSVLTVVFGALSLLVIWQALMFVFVTGEWAVIRENLVNFMVGRFPRGALLWLWGALYLFALVLALTAGFGARNRPPRPLSVLRQNVPLLLGVLVILSLTRSVPPSLLVAGVFLVAGAGWVAGRRLPRRAGRILPFVVFFTPIVAYLLVAVGAGVPLDLWGGLLLTVTVAVAGIVLSFPFGVLLGLGRRSTFPAIRLFCSVYIELVRGVPLITLLVIGSVTIGLLLPPGAPSLPLVLRGLIAIVLFESAYLAESVRGGLQGVPSGQIEAAKAIGLSPLRTTFLIVLPQALRNIIPALVGQFISLYKDTSLLTGIGLLELLGVTRAVIEQPDFRGQGLQVETFVFAAFLYWIACFSMSRASQRLERRLGVGER